MNAAVGVAVAMTSAGRWPILHRLLCAARARLQPAATVRILTAAVALVLVFALAPAAHAHLMVAQKGTLNFSGTGAYLLLSLPVSAFTGVDDDGDGRLSPAELRNRSTEIEAQVQGGVRLLDGGDGGQALPLQGVMLQLSPPDDQPAAPATQLVVMGRYALGAADQPARLRFSLTLFGRSAAEQTQGMSFTWARPSQAPSQERSQETTRQPSQQQAQAAVFTPQARTQAVFPSAPALFVEQWHSGVAHVLGGLDHVLFLLVVLASIALARLGWRHLVWALTCFTAGHAVSLGASLWGGLTVSPGLVEPAIAATIVGMALFDLRQRRGSGAASTSASASVSASARLHLTLVTGCAVIHGLGLAGALNGLTPASDHLLWRLAGFNLGIELAQLGVAAAALLASATLTRLGGPARALQAAHTTSMIAMAAGGWWFIERLGWP